jgi:hypothetical protein
LKARNILVRVWNLSRQLAGAAWQLFRAGTHGRRLNHSIFRVPRFTIAIAATKGRMGLASLAGGMATSWMISGLRKTGFSYVASFEISTEKTEDSMAEPLKEDENSEKAAVTLSGIVEKIIKPISPAVPEKAQIAVHGAEDLYREIRVENTLQDEAGQPVKLKVGAEVAVTIEAEKTETTPHVEGDSTNPPKSNSK